MIIVGLQKGDGDPEELREDGEFILVRLLVLLLFQGLRAVRPRQVCVLLAVQFSRGRSLLPDLDWKMTNHKLVVKWKTILSNFPQFFVATLF